MLCMNTKSMHQVNVHLCDVSKWYVHVGDHQLYKTPIIIYVYAYMSIYTNFKCSFSYMSGCVDYLMGCLRKERERPHAFKAVGQMVLVLKDRMDLHPIIQNVKSHLPQNKDTLAK